MQISCHLAEFLGIMIGDGEMYRTDTGGTNIEINSGADDLDYLEKHVGPLVKRLFSKDARVKTRTRKNEISIVICSKPIGEFLNTTFGLPYGSKGDTSKNGWISLVQTIQKICQRFIGVWACRDLNAGPLA